MKKKLITIILLCTISLSMLGCNDDKQKQVSNDNNKTTQSASNDNKDTFVSSKCWQKYIFLNFLLIIHYFTYKLYFFPSL